MSNNRKIDIMAPVGSYEALAAALQAGADSVYFGVGKLNMRSRSSVNFSLDDLSEIVGRCRNQGVRTYLTLNTVVYDDELAEVKSVVDAAKYHGVSAIIASDMAVMKYARKVGMEIHASTQCNITNAEALKFFAGFCDVMVLARELNMKQVYEISRQVVSENICGPSGGLVQLEMFAHGALCMSVSGKCYLSLDTMNFSANRGACLQICRRPYHVTDKDGGIELDVDNEYIMSPKDLCTVGFVDKLLQAGVSKLKIEGRGRSPEYVKTTVGCYQEAVEAVQDGTYTEEKVRAWTARLSKVYNRGFWGGYYLGKKIGEWSDRYGSQATKKKEYIAKCTNYFARLQVAEFTVETGEINIGDEVLVIGPSSGVMEFSVQEIRTDLKPVQTARRGDVCSIPVPGPVRRGDKLYKQTATEFFE